MVSSICNRPGQVLHIEIGVLDVFPRRSSEGHLNLLALHLQAIELLNGPVGVIRIDVLDEAVTITVVGLKSIVSKSSSTLSRSRLAVSTFAAGYGIV